MVKSPRAVQDHTKIFNREIIFVESQSTVRRTIEMMIQRSISSVLIHNQKDEVVGIFTERDVVRKFTLLDNQAKLEAKINTVMSRPVVFVEQDNLEEAVMRLHFQHGFRHFPVRSAKGIQIQDVVGILTVTDIFRKLYHQTAGTLVKRNVWLLSGDRSFAATLVSLLAVHGLTATRPSREDLTESFIQNCHARGDYLIFDMDFFTVDENLKYLSLAKRGRLILLTSHERLLKPYRDHLDPERQHIFLKPFDISYLCWLLDRDQVVANPA